MTARRPRRSLPWWVRWLHTYVSLLGFGALVFFSITGFTLNHAEWFEGAPRDRESAGTIPAHVLQACERPLGGIELTTWLREHECVHGHAEAPTVDATELTLCFRGAGYVADVFVERSTGAYQLLETKRGVVAVLNDAHKGRHTSTEWSLAIDVSALLLTAAGVTGIWLLWFVKKVRMKGLVAATAATASLALVYLVWQ